MLPATYGRRGACADQGAGEDHDTLEERLREEEKFNDLSPDLEVRSRKLSLNKEESRPRAPSLGDVLILSPQLNVSKKKVDQEQSKKRWTVGEKVVAFISSEGCWKDGVVHEVDASSALIVCGDEKTRPTYVDFSLLKPGVLPAAALNALERDVTSIIEGSHPSATEKPNTVEDPTKTSETEVPRQHEFVLEASMTPGMIFSATSQEFCKFAKTGAGSRYLQNLVTPTNKLLCHKMTDLFLSHPHVSRLMSNAKACFVFQKLLTHFYIFSEETQDKLFSEIETHFTRLANDQFGYHVALAAITHLGLEHGRRLALTMESKPALHCMIKNPSGTFVAQACLPLFKTRTITFIVNSLLGHVVDLSKDKHGAFFIQKFLEHHGHLPQMNLFIEDIIRHLRSVVHHPIGCFVIKKILEVRRDLATYTKILDWVLINIESVYKHETSVKAATLMIDQVKVSLEKTGSPAWKELLDKLVFKLLIGVNSEGRSHVVSASSHPRGHKLMISLLKCSQCISANVRKNLVDTINSYRTSLSSNQNGCKILSLAKGFD